MCTSYVTLPVHPELIKIGFLEFVEERRQMGDKQLFTELKMDGRRYYSGRFQKWFARFLKSSGAARKKTSFHSFRHNFRDALREGGVGRDAVLALGGWTTGGTEEIYGTGLQPKTRATEIAKIRYDGLDLSHLYLQPVAKSVPQRMSKTRSSHADEIVEEPREAPSDT